MIRSSEVPLWALIVSKSVQMNSELMISDGLGYAVPLAKHSLQLGVLHRKFYIHILVAIPANVKETRSLATSLGSMMSNP